MGYPVSCVIVRSTGGAGGLAPPDAQDCQLVLTPCTHPLPSPIVWSSSRDAFQYVSACVRYALFCVAT